MELVDPFYKLTLYNEIEKIKTLTTTVKGFDVQGLGKKLNITVDELTMRNGNHTMDLEEKPRYKKRVHFNKQNEYPCH